MDTANIQGAAPEPAPPPPKKRWGDVAWVSSTYFGEGLPWSFLHQMGTEYLTAIGAPLPQIGYTSWLHLSVWLKFVWSPFVDFFSTKRRWMVVLQVVIGFGMLAIASIAEWHKLPLFWLMMAVLSVIHAMHDIACDGYYMLGLDPKGQALFVGLRVAAFRAAMIVGSGALVYLAGRTNWRMGFGGAGVIMILIGAANARFLPRPPEPARQRASSTTDPIEKSNFWMAYKTFLTQPQAALVLSFMFAFRIGDIMMFAMSRPLLRDIGIDTATRGVLNGIGTGVFIAATMASGATIAKLSLRRCLIPMIYLQNLAILLYVLMSIIKPGFAGVAAIYVAEQTASGIGSAAHVVFLMQRSKRAFSASHFAFATAIVALGSTLSGGFSGYLNQWLGHTGYFTLTFVLSVPSLVMVWFVPRDPIDSEMAFWTWFGRHKDAVAKIKRGDEPVADKLARELHRIDADLTFEISASADEQEFIVSAGGIGRAFPAVQRVVAAAPTIPGWKVIAFRQRKSRDSIPLGDGTTLDADGIMFEVLRSTAGKLDVVLYIKSVTSEPIADSVKSAVYLLLESAIGEYDVQTHLGVIDMKPVSSAPAGARPFRELSEVVDAELLQVSPLVGTDFVR